MHKTVNVELELDSVKNNVSESIWMQNVKTLFSALFLFKFPDVKIVPSWFKKQLIPEKNMKICILSFDDTGKPMFMITNHLIMKFK